MLHSQRKIPFKAKRRIKKRKFYHRGKRCSKGEKRIAVYLDSTHVNYVMEKTFDDCLSPNNRHLRFDFFLPDYNILIEFQGHHHYKPVNKYRKAQISHNKTVRHDKIKRAYTFNSGLWLVEIPHWLVDEVETGISALLESFNNRTMVTT